MDYKIIGFLNYVFYSWITAEGLPVQFQCCVSLMIFPLSPGAESHILSQENDSATHFLQYNRVRA